MYDKGNKVPHRGAFSSGMVCYHQDGCHVQDILKAIFSQESDKDILEYHISKRWTKDALKQVDWIGMQKFLNQLSPITQCNAVQMIHNWQNMGYQKGQFFDSTANETNNVHAPTTRHCLTTCPMGCGYIKNPFHFMICTSKLMCEARQKGINTIRREL